MITREGVSRSELYYHLSEPEEAGIIELTEYREVGGGRTGEGVEAKNEGDQNRPSNRLAREVYS